MAGHRSGALLIFFVIFSLGISAQKPDSTAAFPKWSDSVLLNNVQVVAYRTTGKLLTIPGSVSVVTRENLVPTDGTNLASSLNLIPGVAMQTGTYLTNRIVIRGMGSRTPYNSNRIRAYLNEIPVTSSDGVSTPEEIDLTGIEKIELIKGPSSALYGSGLGGSINLYTNEADSNYTSFGIQYGSYNTLKTALTGGYKSRQARLTGNISRLTSDGYRENNKYSKTSALATARWIGKSWSVNSTILFIDVSGGIPSSIGKTLFEQSPEKAASNWKSAGAYKDYTKGILSLSANGKLLTHFTGNLSFFGKMNDSFERRPFNDLDDQSVSGGIRGRISSRSSKTEFTAGFEHSIEQYKWKLINAGTLLNENRELRNQFNLFGIFYYKPWKTINISVASALNYVTYDLKDLYFQNGDQSGSRRFPLIFSPRAGINYSPNGIISFYASSGHGFSLPSPEETLLPAGDVNHYIKPETGWQFEAGSRLNIYENKLSIDGSFYWIELSNLLVTKRVTEDIFTGINAGRTRHQGIELIVSSDFADQAGSPWRFAADLSFAASLNRFIDFTDDGIVYDGNHLPGIPGETVSLRVKWLPLIATELSTLLQYTGRQYITDSNKVEYPGYFISNIRINHQLFLKGRMPVQFYIGVNNLTDSHYASMLIVNAIGFNNSEPRYYYPGLPRNFFAGIRITL